MDRITDAVVSSADIVGDVCGCGGEDGVQRRLETVETEVSFCISCCAARPASGIHCSDEQRSTGQWLSAIGYDLPANRSGRVSRNLRRRRLRLCAHNNARHYNENQNEETMNHRGFTSVGLTLIVTCIVWPSCRMTSRLTVRGGCPGTFTFVSSWYVPGGTPSIRKCPRSSTTGGRKVDILPSGFVSRGLILDLGGNGPLSNVTVPLRVALPKETTTRTPVTCSPSLTSRPRNKTPSRSMRAIVNPVGGIGLPIAPNDMFIVPVGRPPTRKLPSGPIGDDPEIANLDPLSIEIVPY